jgi:group I intron endonuclease
MSERPGIIYLAVNRVNGKQYVGQTTRSMWARIREHKYKSQSGRFRQLFSKAVAEFGLSTFEFSELEVCRQSELTDRETFWIAHHDCVSPNGYNVSAGGSGLGCKRSPEHVNSIRMAFLGKPKSEEHKAKLCGPKTAEHIANSSKARQSEEYKRRASDSQLAAWGKRDREAQRQRTLAQWAKRKAEGYTRLKRETA